MRINSTVKKNAIVGQLGGPTSVINSSLLGIIQEAVKSKRIKHILGMRDGILGLIEDKIVDLGELELKTLNGLRCTPSSILGSSRHVLTKKSFNLCLNN